MTWSTGDAKIARMESAPHYSFRDVLLAPAKALSAKKIFVMTCFLILALLVYDLFTYLAIALDSERVGTFYSVYGLLPVTIPALTFWLAWMVYVLGCIASVLAVMLGFFAVSALCIEEIRGNQFFSTSGVLRFSFRRLPQLFLSEAAIILFVAFIVLLAVIVGLITRIPYVGEWVYAIFFVIPNFIIALFVVFIIAVLAVSIILLPAVTAAERRGETFTSILETFSTIIRQPVRWILYTAYSLVAAKVCGFVYAYFCYRAIQFLTAATSLGAGEKVWRLLRSGISHLPVKTPLVNETFNIFPGIDWSFSVAAWLRSGADEAAGYLMSAALFIVFVSIFGYMFAIIATGQARGYAAIRYFKDGHKIADEEPLFFQEEPVNPPIDKGQEGEDSSRPEK
ncbi:MAG: hypothetical protein AB1744_02105 [Candidatus Zixiibacteriota bacterium]